MRWFFLLLPWFELFTLFSLGAEIGALATLAYVFLTFVLGVTIIRAQGMEILTRMRAAQNDQVVVGQMLADEVSVGFAGLLLLIPGLFTDALGVLVLFGPLRRRLQRLFAGGEQSRHTFQANTNPQNHRAETLDGEFRRLDD